MVRFLVSLVISVLAIGCMPDPPELPIYYQIQKGLPEEDVAKIWRGASEVNRALSPYYGDNVFLYDSEPFVDPDGFTLEDLTDGNHVVYEIRTDTDIYRQLKDVVSLPPEYDPVGEGMQEDAILGEYVTDEWIMWDESTVMHEFGHMLQMMHREDETSIMYPLTNDADHLTQEDIRAFCLIYDCEVSPF